MVPVLTVWEGRLLPVTQAAVLWTFDPRWMTATGSVGLRLKATDQLLPAAIYSRAFSSALSGSNQIPATKMNKPSETAGVILAIGIAII